MNKVWNFSSEPGRSAYTKILKHNYSSIKPDSVSEFCKITPKGVGFFVDSFELNPDNVTVKIKIDRSSEQRLLPPYTLHFIVYLTNSINPDIRDNILFAFSSAYVSTETPDEFQTITGEFIDYNKRLLTYFKNATVFFSIIKSDSKPLEWSETESKEFIIN